MRHISCLAVVATAAAVTVSSVAFAQKPKPAPPKKEEPPPPKEEPAPKPEEPAAPPVEPKAKDNVEPPHDEWDVKDVEELPGKTYVFIGLRYRGTIIPKFMLNLFVDEGATIYSNSIGVEMDLRKDGFSLIPALSYV